MKILFSDAPAEAHVLTKSQKRITSSWSYHHTEGFAVNGPTEMYIARVGYRCKAQIIFDLESKLY